MRGAGGAEGAVVARGAGAVAACRGAHRGARAVAARGALRGARGRGLPRGAVCARGAQPGARACCEPGGCTVVAQRARCHSARERAVVAHGHDGQLRDKRGTRGVVDGYIRHEAKPNVLPRRGANRGGRAHGDGACLIGELGRSSINRARRAIVVHHNRIAASLSDRTAPDIHIGHIARGRAHGK